VRLTLRTLLAYLDDTLDPAETKLIGQKVTESDAAQELIARIKQVTRRRRLTSPPPTGSGALDPNLIAEYLDNVLSAEQLAEVEEICLASDTHLAEVAAAHQILTLVLGEPALVPPTARQRMYGLIRGREAIPNRKATASPIGRGAIDSAIADEEADETLLLGLSLSRPGSWLRWVLPLMAICLLVAAGVAIWLAVSPGEKSMIAQRTNAPEVNPPIVPAVDQKAQGDQGTQAEQKKPQAETAASTQKKDDEQKKVASAAQQTEPDNKVAKGSEKENDNGKKTAAPAEAAKPPAILPARTEHRDIARMTLIANWPGVLLQKAPEQQGWQRVKPETRVSTMDVLMSLPGYRSQLTSDSGVQLLLWGNLPNLAPPFPQFLESQVVLYQNPDFDLDFKLDRGLVVLSNQKEKSPVRVRLRFLNEVWDVTLPEKNCEVGVQLVGSIRPYTRQPGEAEPSSMLFVFALKGKADLRIRYREVSLQTPAVFAWDSNLGAAPQTKSLERVPDWYNNKLPPGRQVQADEAALKTLARRLIAKDAIDVILGEALHDEDAPVRVLAIHCLGAVGDWSKLIDALAGSDERGQGLDIAAIYEFRYLLGLDAKNDQKLLEALKNKNYKEGQAQALVELLHGYGPDDWADPEIRSTVVDYLMSDKRAIRNVTYFMLCSLVPDGAKIRYDPAGDVTQRERGYAEWKRAVLNLKPPAKPKG
jgi:hypothetical protein